MSNKPLNKSYLLNQLKSFLKMITSNIKHTYSSSSEDFISGKGVNDAISTLKANNTDVTAAKTIKSWKEENGIVNIETQDISITRTQVNDLKLKDTYTSDTKTLNITV